MQTNKKEYYLCSQEVVKNLMPSEVSESIEVYPDEKNTQQLEFLWGETLFNAFADHINEHGWLTTDWAAFIENNYPDFDKNWNDNEIKTDLYQRMYLLDLEEKETETGVWFRPIADI